MAQVTKKWIASNAVDGTKIKLANAQALRARNAADSADVDILKLDGNDMAVITTNLVPLTGGTLTIGDVAVPFLSVYANTAGIGTSTLTDPNGAVTLAVQGAAATTVLAVTDGTAEMGVFVDNAFVSAAQVQVGAVSNHDFGLFANNSQPSIMIKASNNFVGIGPAMIAPAFQLDVSGDARISNLLTLANGLMFDGGTSDIRTLNNGGGSLPLSIITGDAAAGTSGLMNIATGATSAGGTTGQILIESGASTGASGQVIMRSGLADGISGVVTIETGASTAAATGELQLTTGTPSAINQNSGQIVISTGTTTGTGVRGNILTSAPAFVIQGDGSSPQVVRFATGNNANFVELRAAATGVTDTTYVLPVVDGASGDLLSTDGSGAMSWIAPAGAAATNNKELVTLSAGDITNQYIDLAHVAKTNSIDFVVKGGGIMIEGASYDYSVSYTGGAGGNTRITFLNDLATGGAAALVAGDVVVSKYEY